MENDVKKWYLSKTIWINILSLLLEIGQMLLDTQLVPTGTTLLVVNTLNIMLRFMTKTEITK